MNAELSKLADALRARLVVIADHAHRDRDPDAHLQRLISASEQIDSIIASLPKSALDPRLHHYLDGRSYNKALEWIEGTPLEAQVDRL